MMVNFTMQQLEAFFAIAEERSVSSAARHLYVSQSSLSKTLSRLEDSIDIQLFERGTTGMTLTKEGTTLYLRMKAAYNSMAQAVVDARQAQAGTDGTLCVGLHASCERSREFESIWSLLDRYEQTYPGIRVNETLLEYGELRSRLLTRELDVIITHSFALPADSELAILTLQPLRFYIAMSAKSPLAKEEALDFSKLDGQTFFYITRDGSEAEAEFCLQRLHNAGLRAPNIVPMSNIRSAAKAVVRGKGMMLTCHSHGFSPEEMYMAPALDIPTPPHLVGAYLPDNGKAALQSFLKMTQSLFPLAEGKRRVHTEGS